MTDDSEALAAQARCIHMAEHRGDREYNYQDAGTLFMPDGSKVATFDYALSSVMAREVLALHLAAMS